MIEHYKGQFQTNTALWDLMGDSFMMRIIKYSNIQDLNLSKEDNQFSRVHHKQIYIYNKMNGLLKTTSIIIIEIIIRSFKIIK